jgi:hypothetical protein
MLTTDYLIIGSGAAGHELRRPIVDRDQCKHRYRRPASRAGRPLERRLFICTPACAISVLWRGLAPTRQQPHRRIRPQQGLL